MHKIAFSFFALLGLALAGCDALSPKAGSGAEVLPPGAACSSQAGIACAPNAYCKHEIADACGAKGVAGTCTLRSGDCKDEDNPVCGCDGETYYSPCAAASEGISVAYLGVCHNGKKSPAALGGRCGGAKQVACQEELFCNFPANDACGVDRAYGTCSDKPNVDSCKASGPAVCGCDGQNYPSACHAHAQGISVYRDEACTNEGPAALGQACGGKDLPALCGTGLFCDLKLQAKCGEANLPGVCAKRPDACNANYDPVCGCDSRTYGNACYANANGVAVASKGECGSGKEGEPCGRKGLKACEESLFCEIPIQASCNVKKAPGRCKVIPEECTDYFDPVCGCDGKSYANPCYAQGAGVSVARRGNC